MWGRGALIMPFFGRESALHGVMVRGRGASCLFRTLEDSGRGECECCTAAGCGAIESFCLYLGVRFGGWGVGGGGYCGVLSNLAMAYIYGHNAFDQVFASCVCTCTAISVMPAVLHRIEVMLFRSCMVGVLVWSCQTLA